MNEENTAEFREYVSYMEEMYLNDAELDLLRKIRELMGGRDRQACV